MITNAAGGIITKGLGRPACAGMIVNYFSLTLAVKVIPPQPPITGGGGGGGAYPGPAWNVFTPAQIQNIYKPYAPEYYVPRRTHIINIRINFRGREIEKMYEVTPKRADQVVNILNLADKARSRYNVTVSNLRKLAPSISDFRRVATKISVAIKSIRREKD